MRTRVASEAAPAAETRLCPSDRVYMLYICISIYPSIFRSIYITDSWQIYAPGPRVQLRQPQRLGCGPAIGR